MAKRHRVTYNNRRWHFATGTACAAWLGMMQPALQNKTAHGPWYPTQQELDRLCNPPRFRLRGNAVFIVEKL